ncbi:phosphoribosylamine--glycine ligase [Thermoactinomyces sp. DSM 45891]|uniref:phosphoribosylamine--glycine ligase n=1 Tax=Thermoactinomyces sp. DSM 45891 TaxID=1761907 RepID=UPI0009106A3F|nr:phosphoribosylamine--glycine ligase [Thermoactinomyces sp. DSM 45891]SFX67659.1 phosphoribosylamine--glycine ligase [Thermoactinomyces sp. DSM 45891]
MRILIIGSGGREHALLWKIAQSPKVKEIFVAPGNAGMTNVATLVPISVDDLDGLRRFALEQQIDFTIVGPEVPLLLGIVDQFQEVGLSVFGPNGQAAQIEGSKRFAKDLMKKHDIPTADYRVFTDADEAKQYVSQKGVPIVIKADGLAAGKGVVVAATLQEAEQAISEAMEQKVFGSAGDIVVVEEFLVGQELSLMAFVDGTTVVPMVPAQDHKPAYDGDLGPNTGGMGTYSPVPQFSNEVLSLAVQTILEPVVQAFQKEGIDYRGVLYVGLMMTQEGPKVIEFNARFGDPETQVVLPRLTSDLIEILIAVVEGRLHADLVTWSDEAAVCVILSAGGYPGPYQNGLPITGRVDQLDDKGSVYHAGTRYEGSQLVTAGGRVFGVTGLGENLQIAREKAYRLVEQIHFPNAHYRKDIAEKAIQYLEQIHI